MSWSRALVTTAAGAYAANCALGISAATRLIDTSNFRWLHHALYIATSTTTGVACAVAALEQPRTAVALAPAAAPLFFLQRQGAHPLPRHTRTALLAAPCYVASLALAWR